MLVDDSDITRAGFASVLGSCTAVQLVAALNHHEALDWADGWDAADVVLVDAADEGRAGDQFPGVGVVRHVRACAREPQPVIIVITGHFLHDGLRYRMAEAGADFYFFRGNLRTADALLDIVLRPERFRRGVPPVTDPEQQRLIGISSGVDVDGLVSYVSQNDLGAALNDKGPLRDDPRGRHWLRRRTEIAAAGSIKAVNVSTGDSPYRGQNSPSWRQLRRIYAWAARVEEVDDGQGGDLGTRTDPPGVERLP